MSKISKAANELRELDELAVMDSPVHNIHPLTKLLLTIAYIVLVVSFDKYDLSGITAMLLFPVFIFQLSGISIGTCFYKLRVVLPFVCAVGLFNPLFDRTIAAVVGGVSISGGVISMITLILKGVFTLMASFLLIATTPIDRICAALRQIHVPLLLVTLLLLTYRYISVMVEELSVMTDAYHLRAPRQKGIHISAWGSFLGQLLLRSMDRSDELYSSMQLRGFKGNFYYACDKNFTAKDAAVLAFGSIVLVIFRIFNIAAFIGTLFV